MGSMSCIRFHAPGGPEKLHLEHCAVPETLNDDEVLIKVSAAGILWPELSWPLYQRGDGTPIQHIPCHDFSGTVVRVGPQWKDQRVQVGSEVCAFTQKFVFEDGAMLRKYEGAAAEYAVASADTLALKPKNLSLVESASIPLSALTAWQALHDHGALRSGQKLLVTGAAGATGLWAVQTAKMMGAYVVGTASSAWSFETLRQLGIDDVIDYKTQSLAEAVTDIDLVLDTVGNIKECAKVIKPDGKILSIVDQKAQEASPNAKWFVVEMKREQLEQIVSLVEGGRLRAFVDSTFALERTADAFRKAANGHLHGKVVVQVSA